jgi:hypothetical protein
MDLREQAKARIAELRREIREWESWLAKADELAAKHSGFQMAISELATNVIVKRYRVESEGKGQKIARLSKEHIQAHGPKQTSELVSALEAQGIQFGESPRAELASWLNKSGLFESRRGEGGWFLKEEAPAEKNSEGA